MTNFITQMLLFFSFFLFCQSQKSANIQQANRNDFSKNEEKSFIQNTHFKKIPRQTRTPYVWSPSPSYPKTPKKHLTWTPSQSYMKTPQNSTKWTPSPSYIHNNPKPTQPFPPDDDNTTEVIIITCSVIGGALLIAIIVTVIVIFNKKRKKNINPHEKMIPLNSNVLVEPMTV